MSLHLNQPVVIFLASGGWPARYQAVMLGVTAASLGDAVTVVLAFEPLRAFVEGRFEEGGPPTVDEARVPPLLATLDEARRELGLRVVACETAVRLAGLDPEVARARLDGLEPLPTIWRLAQQGRALSF
jgi:peroxiredoxin family protein